MMSPNSDISWSSNERMASAAPAPTAVGIEDRHHWYAFCTTSKATDLGGVVLHTLPIVAGTVPI